MIGLLEQLDNSPPARDTCVQVTYTGSLPDGVYVVFRSGPPRLMINEAWWRSTRPIERIHTLEPLWARLQLIPQDSWETPPSD
jgi:hypothetical protein